MCVCVSFAAAFTQKMILINIISTLLFIKSCGVRLNCDEKGSATTPPHKLSHTFKFKDYAPVAFAYLRRMFGVNEFDFLLSVCGNANFIEFISNAKSGQFFFYSSDGRYMIKSEFQFFFFQLQLFTRSVLV